MLRFPVPNLGTWTLLLVNKKKRIHEPTALKGLFLLVNLKESKAISNE